MKEMFLICTFVAVAMGCAKTASSNVKTEAIVASYSVDGDNYAKATCTARFQVGGTSGTYLELDDGDTVDCNGVPMQRSEDMFNQVTYSTTLANWPGRAYTITFSRAGESVYQSVVTMPEIINRPSPTNGDIIRKSAGVRASWTPSSSHEDRMDTLLSYATTQDSKAVAQSDSPERGNAMLVTSEAAPGDVNASLTMRRARKGSLSPGLSAGSISASQSVSISVKLVD